MFDFVGKNKRVAQVILAIITLPFAFFGVDSYIRQSNTADDSIAKVGSDKISRAEFDNALREQQERMRSMLRERFDPAMFDNPEFRFNILEQLVNQRLLAQLSAKQNIVVSDEIVHQYIMDFPAFQENGKFSPERVRSLLASQGMTENILERQIRQQLQMQPVQDPFAQASFVSRTGAEQFMRLNGQQREVVAASIDIDPYLAQVKPDDAAVKAYYDGNQAAFQVPEQVRLETLSLTLESIAGKITVEPQEVKTAYDTNIATYSDPEQRQASHILIAAKSDAKAADKEAAKKRAEELAQQAKAAPDKFGELAKANSDDPGSKEQGGDLGYFGKGAMDKPFEDAVFAIKQTGDIVGPIESAFGFHVIRLTGVRPEKVKPFDEVKAQIEQDLKRQRATKQYAEAAEKFQNLVYENADKLQPAADALQLKVVQSGMLTRAQVQALAQKSQKFAQAVFSPESLSSKRNTEAIEIAPNTLMAARVIEHKPAAPRPFDEVKNEIFVQLQRKGASELAAKDGQAALADLQAGKTVPLAWDKPREFSRQQRQPGISDEAVTRIFRADPAKLPAYAGALNEKGGYSIYRITKVTDPELKDDAVKNATTQLSGEISRELFMSYLAALKKKSEVVVHQENLDKKEKL
ncbi:MAG: SurA N-terminal domain-containing protein [Burkholderiales bacterium]|nr:SurA N-terminal domain-containing protein [Burkholderiales bacterium]